MDKIITNTYDAWTKDDECRSLLMSELMTWIMDTYDATLPELMVAKLYDGHDYDLWW